MSALLGLAQAAPEDGARGALVSQMAISGALSTPTQPQPKPKPGSAKAFARKVAPAATQYKSPVRGLAPENRDSVQGGFLAVGAGAEELKTLSLPAAQKGANLLPETDPVIAGGEKTVCFTYFLCVFKTKLLFLFSSLSGRAAGHLVQGRHVRRQQQSAGGRKGHSRSDENLLCRAAQARGGVQGPAHCS